MSQPENGDMEMKKLDIAFVIPGMPFNGDTLKTKSLGGSESAAIYLARALAKRGHDVLLFCNCDKPGMYDGVNYILLGGFIPFATSMPVDVVIGQREHGIFSTTMTSKFNILWCHDLALGRNAAQVMGVMWNVDRVAVLSEYMQKQYTETYGLDLQKGIDEASIFLTRNGIDLDAIKDFPKHLTNHRDPFQLVYASRFERGLDNLLRHIMPELIRREPRVRLKICGYDNNVPHLAGFYDECKRLIAAMPGHVEWIGNLTKRDLYALYHKSGALVYPTPSEFAKGFAEISCITVMESMMCGLPVITSKRGALPETLHADAGRLIDGDPWSKEYIEAFISATLEVMQAPGVGLGMSVAGKHHAQSLSWDSVAEQWEQEIFSGIKKLNDSPTRLAKHFIRHSDIHAARKLLPEAHESLKAWKFDKCTESFREHYAAMGMITDARLSQSEFTEAHFAETNEQRFKIIEKVLAENKGAQNILDYGCGHGWMPIYLERRLGRKWHGVDVDPLAVKWCWKFAGKFAKTPANMRFVVDSESVESGFDALIMSEVLEHCVDPIKVINQQEQRVKKGGMVLITVPYGPREWRAFRSIKHRNHLHELDVAQIKRLFKNKKGLDILACVEERIHELHEPAGFYFVKYEADHKPVMPFDWERKLTIQRPRETVALSMIVGPGAEKTLEWCLDSVSAIVDEIIAADCGMSEEAKAILNKHGARIVPGVDPKVEGFDEARNVTLPYITSDWVLWMDSDERLLGGWNIYKYLRRSIYQGYSIRQHHFSVDAGFKPDIPVRLFRKNRMDGKTMRWYGSIHEHPEMEINSGPGRSIILTDVHIAHIGYLSEDGRRQKFRRNYPLLKKSMEKYPERLLNYHFLMRDNILLNSFELQQNGGNITQEMAARYQENIAVWREKFRGKGLYLSSDAIENYSIAVHALGIGAQTTINVSASRNGHGPALEPKTYWFASEEDLQEELKWRASASIAPLLSENY